jgi:hypothetical protein
VTLLLAAALACLAGAAAAEIPAPPAWEAAGFSHPRIMPLSTDAYYQDRSPGWQKGSLPLYFLMLRGGNWTEGQVRDHLERVARVYAQCGLRISGATLIEADPPAGRTKFVRYPAAGQAGTLPELVEASPLKARPVYYLFRGFTDVDDDAAFSQANFTDGDGANPALYDGIYLPAGVNSQKYAEERKGSPYSVAAHELLHVLTRDGQHVNVAPPNLMNIWRTRADAIRPEDCAKALASPLVAR